MYKTPRDYEWIREINNQLEFKKTIALYIRHNADNVIIGRLFIKLSDPHDASSIRNKNADVSVRMLDTYRQKGFMKQAIQMTLDQFDKSTIKNLIAAIMKGNDGSKQLFKKFGFKKVTNAFVSSLSEDISLANNGYEFYILEKNSVASGKRIKKV